MMHGFGGESGLTFAPTAQGQQRQGEPGGQQSPVQQAIRVLSLRMPRTLGGAPAPPALLQSQGMAGMPTPLAGQGTANNPLLEILRRMLMGGGGPSPNMPGMAPSMPGMGGQAFRGVGPMMSPPMAPSPMAPPPFTPSFQFFNKPGGGAPSAPQPAEPPIQAEAPPSLPNWQPRPTEMWNF